MENTAKFKEMVKILDLKTKIIVNGSYTMWAVYTLHQRRIAKKKLRKLIHSFRKKYGKDSYTESEASTLIQLKKLYS